MSKLRETILAPAHRDLGAKFVGFSGWNMPVQYSDIKSEHLAVREACGIFDVSHMGECFIEGPDAEKALNNIVTNDVSKIKNFKAQYNLMCYDDGGCVDDLLVYRYNSEKFFLCLNAGNVEKDLQWLQQNLTGDCQLRDVSGQTALLSLQGPKTKDLFQQLNFQVSEGPGELKSYQFCEGTLEGKKVVLARTGYTGEDGFEVFMDNGDASDLWALFLEKGKALGLVPVGLGARDTLRLEAGLALYGHELTEERSPYDANLSWVIKLNKPKFVGKAALLQASQKAQTTLVGIEMVDPGIARQAYAILDENKEKIGEISSGAPSPSTGKNIALAFKDKDKTAAFVEIRGQAKKIQETSLPFVKKNYEK